MPEEILEITPTGGLYCRIDLNIDADLLNFARKTFIDCARPNGFSLSGLLQDMRLATEDECLATDGDLLRWGLTVICESGLASALAHDARFDNWTIAIELGEDGPARIDRPCRHLVVPCAAQTILSFVKNPQYRQGFLFQLVRGLRSIWHANTNLVSAGDLLSQEQIKLARLVEADLDLCALLVAYQLKQKNSHDLWRYNLTGDLEPLAVTLAECLKYDDANTADAGKISDEALDSLSYLFQDWFNNDERLAEIDHAILTQIDQHTAVQPDTTKGFVEFEDVLQLGVLPGGLTSYLDLVAGEIMTDDFYTRMDPLNQAHLNQILSESMNAHESGGLVFRDADLARKIFPANHFEAVV